jgi:hypothetical protein
VAGYANNAPAVWDGNSANLNRHIHKNGTTLYAWSGEQAALADFTGPTGFNIGSRNILRGPSAFTMDAGLAKNFAILPNDRLNLKFRADFFNVLNHPVFNSPNTDVGSSSSNFGKITSGIQNTTYLGGPRVGQFALRLEF